MQARLDGCGAFDCLEVDGDIVDEEHHDGSKGEGIDEGREDRAMEDDTRGNCGGVTFEVLNVAKSEEREAKDDEEDDDAGG